MNYFCTDSRNADKNRCVWNTAEQDQNEDQQEEKHERVFDHFHINFILFYFFIAWTDAADRDKASSYLSEDLSCVPLFLSKPLGSHPVLFSPLQRSFPLLRRHLQ